VFGDIDIEEHLTWCERVCSNADMQAFHPLWKRPRRDVLDEFFDLGFHAIIVAVKRNILNKEFLGKTLFTRWLLVFRSFQTLVIPYGSVASYFG
jgi:diphthine-ammonia ligase